MSDTINKNHLRRIFAFYSVYIEKVKINDLFMYLTALMFYKNKKYSSALELLNKMSEVKNPNANFKLGMCYFREKKWAEAEYYINKAISAKEYNKSWVIQLYQARSKMGQLHLNDDEKLDYILTETDFNKNSNIDEIKQLLLEKSYSAALKLCDEQRFLDPLNSEVWFLTGCIYDEFQSYEQSSYFFKNSCDLKKKNRNYKYRYAYSLEKNGDLDLASEIYDEIVQNSSDEVSKYGIGILHAKRGLWEFAIKEFHKYENKSDYEIYYHLYNAYFFNLDHINSTKYLERYISNARLFTADLYLKLAKSYFILKDYLNALINYNYYIDRKNNVEKDVINDYFKCLANTNNTENPIYNYNLNVLFSDKSSVNINSFIKTSQEKFWNKYIYYTENLPIRENAYLFESFAGDTISCNPYAILLEMLKEDNSDDNLFILVCNDENKIPQNLLFKNNIIFVKKNSDLYIRYLSTSKYLINNTTFSPYFYRREEQVYLMTWHGTPIKSLGRDQKNGFMSHANVTRNFLHATHIISPNAHTTDVILNKYDIKDLYSGEFYEIGYPRVDLTLNNNILSRKDLDIEDDKKIILYAPTWRGGDKLEGNVDVDKLLSDLTKLSEQKGCVIYYKSHHLIESLLKDIDIPVRLVPENIDINLFLNIVDCLISDYSSIIFDYLPLNRPVISYIYDYDEYIVERGELYFSKEDLFGTICSSITEVIDTLREVVAESIQYDYSGLINEYCPYDLGNTSKILVDILRSNSNVAPLDIDKKPVHMIFCGSFLPNGVTNSFKNLIKVASQFEECKFALVFDLNAVQAKEDNYNSFAEIQDLPIILLPRMGSIMNTADEKWLKTKLELQHDFYNSSSQEIVFQSYKREINRLFSNTKFTSVINFDGYSVFWVILLSLVDANKKVIYLHNNMYAEWKTRFPYLKTVFSMYENYNILNSVSEACFAENNFNLTTNLNISTPQVYSNNIIDFNNIIRLSSVEPETKISEFDDFKGIKFINVARLSVEKDQEKLIRAFHKFVKQTSENVRLYIVGYGKLEDDLRNLIKTLNLENLVFLLGYQSNPYYFIKNSDLFVFSSNYEGQGLVLLESMILKLPVVTTNIEGVQSVVNGTKILAVDNSIDGLVDGMLQFIDNKVDITDFDYVAYNKLAIKQFSTLLDINYDESKVIN